MVIIIISNDVIAIEVQSGFHLIINFKSVMDFLYV